MKRLKNGLLITLMVIFVSGIVTPARAFDICKIYFGVVPLRENPQPPEAYTALADYLTAEMGVNVEIVVLPDINEFRKRTKDGSLDLLFCYPLQYVRANSDGGYRAIAKLKDDPFCGIIVVRRDPGFEKVSDLVGKKIAFSSPTDYPAAVLTRETMVERYDLDYYTEMKPVFVGTGKDAVMAVCNGKVEAAGITPYELSSLDKKTREKLRVILKSPPHSQMPLSVSPALPDYIVEKILHAIMTMHHTHDGKHALKLLNWEGFTEAKNEEYDEDRLLMDKLSTPDKPFKEEFYWR